MAIPPVLIGAIAKATRKFPIAGLLGLLPDRAVWHSDKRYSSTLQNMWAHNVTYSILGEEMTEWLSGGTDGLLPTYRLILEANRYCHVFRGV